MRGILRKAIAAQSGVDVAASRSDCHGDL